MLFQIIVFILSLYLMLSTIEFLDPWSIQHIYNHYKIPPTLIIFRKLYGTKILYSIV